jgi:uncharacterized SAM-binding protein YcdF (DUF218 family)
MEQNPYQTPPEGESAAASTVEPWRKFTIAAAIVTVVASFGIVALVLVNFLLYSVERPSYLFLDILSSAGSFLCLTAFIGLIAWIFCSVFLLRARRRESADSRRPA